MAFTRKTVQQYQGEDGESRHEGGEGNLGSDNPNPLDTVETLDVEKPALLAPQGGIEPTPGRNRNVGQAGFSADVTRMLEYFHQRPRHVRGPHSLGCGHRNRHWMPPAAPGLRE